MKIYLVWNEAKTECVGFKWKESATYAASKGGWNADTMHFTGVGDDWITRHGDEECTIQEIEV